jgi:phosphopantothenate-cysteine ligase
VSLNDRPSVHPSGPGTRGATSAEYFLKAGYSVIFMHRQFSLQPFSRHYSHSTNPFLDFLEIESDTDRPRDPPRITATPSKNDDLLEVLTAYKSVQQAGLLHTLTFVTVNDYLWLLRAVSQELSTLGRNALYYLAAAVSDFFLPRQKMVRRRSLQHRSIMELMGFLVRTQDSIWEGQLVD